MNKQIVLWHDCEECENEVDLEVGYLLKKTHLKELEDALTWPKRLRQVASQIDIPVQITIPEFDFMFSAEQAVLDEIKSLFIHAPLVQINKQRFSGHNLSSNRVAKSFYLRELAFLEESRLQTLAD